jgi:outer membrane protein OmpA-like peptidoglycan-associated protein
VVLRYGTASAANTTPTDPNMQDESSATVDPDAASKDTNKQPAEGTTPTEPTTKQPTAKQPTAKQPVAGTAAVDAKDIPAVDLLFDTDSSTPSSDSRTELERVATWAKCTPKGVVILEGHADARGTQSHNMKLSGERATAVRAKLIAMGVPSDRIVLTIYGENGPRRGSLADDRRVTVRAAARPLQPDDLVSQK